MEQRFTTDEVVALTGMTPRQLQWWDERGIVCPAREGRRRLYSLDDVAEVVVIGELRARGFSLQRVRKLLRALQREFGKRLVETVTARSEYHLLTDGAHIFLRTSPEQVVDLLKTTRQPMFAICLSDTVRQIRSDIVAATARTVPVAAQTVPDYAASRPAALPAGRALRKTVSPPAPRPARRAAG
jgi:DNA-binding transcriptional MerR regulator